MPMIQPVMSIAMGVVSIATAAASAQPVEPGGDGLVRRPIPVSWAPEWRHTDFENCRPATAIKVQDPTTTERTWLVDAPADRRPADGFWVLRQPRWTRALLNVVGNPGDLIYDPRLQGRYDIVLHLRAVDPVSAIAIRLDNEAEFEIVRTPEATPDKHMDVDIPWRANQVMDGRMVVLRNTGQPVYLQGLTFAPAGRPRPRRRIAVDTVTVAATQGRHYAFPGLTRLRDGDLAVVFRDGIAHVCPYGRIAMVTSADNGRTWSEPRILADTPSDERDPSIHTLPDGRVLVSFNVWNSWMANAELKVRYAAQTARIEADGPATYTGAKFMLSADGGRSWDAPFRVPVFTPHGPSLARDGTLYHIRSRTEKSRRRRLVEFWQGSADARTWHPVSTVGESLYLAEDRQRAPVFDEPYTIQLADGDWLACIRVNWDGYVRLARSHDDGRTWSEPRKTAIRGYPQHLLQLRDGRVLMTYGYRFEPAGVRAVVSADGGRTWDLHDEIILHLDAPNWDLGYPVSLELEDGLVFTVYYMSTPGSECTIEGAFYRP